MIARRKWLSSIFLTLFFLSTLGVGYSTVYRSSISRYNRSDFPNYKVAGRVILEGKDIYDVKMSRGWPYLNSPLLALAMVPFSRMSMFHATFIWFFLSVLFLLAAASLGYSMFPQISSAGKNILWMGLPIIMALPAGLSGLMRGQVSALLLFLVILSLYFYKRGKEELSGLFLAMSINLKVFPVYLIFYFLAKRRFRLLTWTAAWSLIFFVALPSAMLGYHHSWELHQRWRGELKGIVEGVNSFGFKNRDRVASVGAYSASNQSLVMAVNKAFKGLVADGGDGDHSGISRAFRVTLASLLILMLLLAAYISSRRKGDYFINLELSMMMIIMPLFSYVAWHHYFTIMFFPYAAALHYLLCAPKRKVQGRIMAVTLTLAFLANALYFAVKPLRDYYLLMGGTLTLWTGLLIVTWIEAARRESLAREPTARSG